MRVIISTVIFRLLENLIADVLGILFIVTDLLICSTLRYRIINERVIEETHEQGKRVLFACWHGGYYAAPRFFFGKKLLMAPIDSFRGKLLAASATKILGYKVIHYPETGTPGEKALAVSKMLKTLQEEGYDMYLLVDGPPRTEHHRSNPGLLFFSQKTGFPLVPIGIHMKTKFTLFWRWDRFEIPLPFSRVAIAFGEPFVIPREVETADLEKMTRELDRRMDEAAEIAKKSLDQAGARPCSTVSTRKLRG